MKRIAHPDFAAPVVYDSMPLPEDSSDNQVAATIVVMKRLAREDSQCLPVKRVAAELLSSSETPEQFITGVHTEANRRMYFQQDDQTAGPMGSAVEVLIRPAYVVEMSDAGNAKVPGDCDCFSMFVASLLLAGGVDCAFATSSTMRGEPDTFAHVYVVAFPSTDRRVVIDASHGKCAGWEAPNYGRYQEWPLNSGVSSCAELLLMGLIFVAGWLFEWGDKPRANYLEAA
jgi:hypothetical protein